MATLARPVKAVVLALNLIAAVSGFPQGSPSSSSSGCLVKEESGGEAKPCVFPFQFHGKTFSACTKYTDKEGKFWCSTKVDSKGAHVSGTGAWGYCDMTSPACNGIVSAPTREEASSGDPTKGTWKPSVEKDECGGSPSAEFIVGGEDARPGEFGFAVLLGYLQPNGKVYYTCGGTLINRYYVVTAAHCVPDNQRLTQVRVGEYRVGEDQVCSGKTCLPPVQDIGVDEIKVHEDWDPAKFAKGNDIALIRLKTPAKLGLSSDENSIVTPICLPWKDTDPGNDLKVGMTKGTIVGWGRVTNNNTEARNNYREFSVAQRTLQKAEVPVASDEDCKSLNVNFSSSKQVCAGGVKGIDSCNGDSGGPLLIRERLNDPWFLVGIVSYGTRECGTGVPAIYTRVRTYVDWIAENLRE